MEAALPFRQLPPKAQAGSYSKLSPLTLYLPSVISNSFLHATGQA